MGSGLSQLGWFLLIIGGVVWLVFGFYKGPVKISQPIYAAKIIKYESGSHKGSAWAYIYVQGNGELMDFRLPRDGLADKDLLNAVSAIRRGDEITIHEVTSNYAQPTVWKVESDKWKTVFATNQGRVLYYVSEQSTDNMLLSKRYSTFYLAAVAIFLILEILVYRKHGVRIIQDSVIYKATRRQYGAFIAFAVLMDIVLLGFAVNILMVHLARESRTKDNLDILIYVVVGCVLIFSAAVWFLVYKPMKTVKYDLVLDRKGLHYSELAEKYGFEFIPWTDMRFCGHDYPKGPLVIYLKQPHPSGVYTIDIPYLKLNVPGTTRLISDIRKGMAGELFPSPTSAAISKA